MVRKLKNLAKDYAWAFSDEGFNYAAADHFEEGFKTAFKTINESLAEEITKLEQYPMMGERILAVKLYMKKMDDLLQEIDCE